MASRKMAPGFSLATSSISIPPAALAMKTPRPGATGPLCASCFAAGAGMDLGYHDGDVRLQALGRFARFFLGEGNFAAGSGYAIAGQNRLRLILVNLH